MVENLTQAGVISFSTEIDSSDGYSYSYDEVMNTVQNLVHIRGMTNIPIALQEAFVMINKDENSRVKDSSVRKMVIVLTDGRSNGRNKGEMTLHSVSDNLNQVS